jgi:hypothetical protein
MVRRASLLLLLALLLTSCSFFTTSLFPGYLAQAEKSYDLGSTIDDFLSTLGSADYRWYPQVFVLTTAAGVDYGGVLIEIDSLPNKLLLLADPAGGVYSFDYPGLNRRHLTDVDGDFVVGKVAIDTTTLTLVAPQPSIDDNDFLGLSFNARNYLFWTESAASNQFWYASATGWPVGTGSAVTLDDFQYGFELRNVYCDPLAVGKETVLVFFNNQINQVYVFFIPSTGFSVPLATYYPPLTFSDVDAGRVIYTRKGIVLADDRSAVLKDFGGGDTGKKLDLGQGGDVRIAFDIEGDHFYVFNPEDQKLYRGKTGW